MRDRKYTMIKAFGYALLANILMGLMQYVILDLNVVEDASLDAFFFLLNPFILFCLNFAPPKELTLIEQITNLSKMYIPSVLYISLAIFWIKHERKLFRVIGSSLIYLYVLPSLIYFIFNS